MIKLSRDDTLLSLKITKVTGIKEKSDKRFLTNHMFVTDDDEIAFSLFYRYACCTGPSSVPHRNNNDCVPHTVTKVETMIGKAQLL